MALTSFTLRKTSTGSYVQQSGATDSSLRADGISSEAVLASITTGNNTFSANIVSKGVVRLEWTLSEALVGTVTSGVAPVELKIVSSYSGEPVTVRDGLTVKTITSTSLDTFYDDTPAVLEGRWVYYGLFVKYSDGTDYWYDRAATLYIQIPIDHNSLASLWSKIPEYYKSLDYGQTPLSSGYTPLYAFLELFANELDRTRTLIETVALSNDPALSVTPALEQLAYETGLEVSTNEIGTSKVRALMNNIGTLRQTKGTVGSIVSYISAMSGCAVSYVFDGNNITAPHTFNVYAQRVNFISDPRFVDSTITTTNYPSSNSSVFTTNTWGVLVYGGDSTGASNPSVTNVTDGITITMPSGSYLNRSVFVYPQREFPYHYRQNYGTSYDYTSTSGASFSNVHVSGTWQVSNWEAGTISNDLFLDNAWNSGPFTAYTSTTGRPSYEYPAQENAQDTYSYAVPVLVFIMAPGSSITIKRWLFEPAFNGDYFDGNTREGGYIPINTGSAGQGTFDYYWDTTQQGANDAFSYYLLDHERTIRATERVIENNVAPVTLLGTYNIVWDYYFGKT